MLLPLSLHFVATAKKQVMRTEKRRVLHSL